MDSMCLLLEFMHNEDNFVFFSMCLVPFMYRKSTPFRFQYRSNKVAENSPVHGFVHSSFNWIKGLVSHLRHTLQTKNTPYLLDTELKTMKVRLSWYPMRIQW